MSSIALYQRALAEAKLGTACATPGEEAACFVRCLDWLTQAGWSIEIDRIDHTAIYGATRTVAIMAGDKHRSVCEAVHKVVEYTSNLG